MISKEFLALFERVALARKVLVCGSTRPGEESILLSATLTLKERFEDLLVVLVPRHPQRCAQVKEISNELGLKIINVGKEHKRQYSQFAYNYPLTELTY